MCRDVLELELDEEEDLEFGDASDGQQQVRRVSPVKIRASAMSSSSQETGNGGGGSSYSSSVSNLVDAEDDDEEDESSGTRSRFRSERNTEDLHSQSSSAHSSVGNPIQTLGKMDKGSCL
jgi:hypothetical protein